MRINQFHSGIAVGDAISNQIFLIQKILIKNGFESEVYVEYIPENLKNKVKNIKNYKGDEDSILIIHHSMGTNVFDKCNTSPPNGGDVV